MINTTISRLAKLIDSIPGARSNNLVAGYRALLDGMLFESETIYRVGESIVETLTEDILFSIGRRTERLEFDDVSDNNEVCTLVSDIELLEDILVAIYEEFGDLL